MQGGGTWVIHSLEGRTPVRPSSNTRDEFRRQRTAALQNMGTMELQVRLDSWATKMMQRKNLRIDGRKGT